MTENQLFNADGWLLSRKPENPLRQGCFYDEIQEPRMPLCSIWVARSAEADVAPMTVPFSLAHLANMTLKCLITDDHTFSGLRGPIFHLCTPKLWIWVLKMGVHCTVQFTNPAVSCTFAYPLRWTPFHSMNLVALVLRRENWGKCRSHIVVLAHNELLSKLMIAWSTKFLSLSATSMRMAQVNNDTTQPGAMNSFLPDPPCLQVQAGWYIFTSPDHLPILRCSSISGFLITLKHA